MIRISQEEDPENKQPAALMRLLRVIERTGDMLSLRPKIQHAHITLKSIANKTRAEKKTTKTGCSFRR